MESQSLLTVGNSAKLYCLNWIENYIRSGSRAITILDLGSGTANNFLALLQKYPQTRYVGIEPSPAACKQAEQNLRGLNGTVINALAYDVYPIVKQKFDVVVSFSALEHVYQRKAFLQSAKECLATEGYFLINYDAGHFVDGGFRDRVKNIVGPLLARFGRERYYQAFVKEQEFEQIVGSLDLRIVEAKSFNTRLKGLYKSIPEALRNDYMQHWLDFELWLNQQELPYNDKQAGNFFTRNFILTHSNNHA
ncbi:MAG: class I SAM-dependent methyltransferase [Anaerolineae bacterium]|nr:class I SAM-dependent methyltransferase [Anaerolineae bacterium]